MREVARLQRTRYALNEDVWNCLTHDCAESMRGCSWTSSRTAVSGATGSHEEPPRNVREWASGDRGAMLVSSDLCLSGASIAGCQDPGDTCSTSTTSKFKGMQLSSFRSGCSSHLMLCNTRCTFLAGPFRGRRGNSFINHSSYPLITEHDMTTTMTCSTIALIAQIAYCSTSLGANLFHINIVIW